VIAADVLYLNRSAIHLELPNFNYVGLVYYIISAGEVNGLGLLITAITSALHWWHFSGP
jgi:hypothetical protein